MVILVNLKDPAELREITQLIQDHDKEHLVYTSSNKGGVMLLLQSLQHLDIVITDVFLKQESGFVVRDKVRQKFPGVKAVFFTEQDLASYQNEVGGDYVYLKPVNTEALLSWIESMDPKTQTALEATVDETQELQKELTQRVEKAPRENLLKTGAETDSGYVEKNARARIIGDYQLLNVLGEEERAITYEALQLSIDRRVIFKLLKEEFYRDRHIIDSFLNDSKFKADVSSPHIAEVYEAREEEGAVFYTREYIEGSNLPQWIERGEKVGIAKILEILKILAEISSLYRENNLYYRPLGKHDFYITHSDAIRVENTVRSEKPLHANESQCIAQIGEGLKIVADYRGFEQVASRLNRLFHQMREGSLSWKQIYAEVVEIEGEMAQKNTREGGQSQDRVEERKPDPKKRLLPVFGFIGILLILGVGIFLFLKSPWRVILAK